MKKEIIFNPAWDKRSSDPKKNYGIHGVEMLFMLTGKNGAVQFKVFTNWQLPHVQEETDSSPPNTNFPYLLHKPMAADLGYHSPKPMYEGQTMMTEKCEHLGGKPCYYDGSGLAAEKVFEVLLNKGSEGVWEYMARYYHDIFDSEK